MLFFLPFFTKTKNQPGLKCFSYLSPITGIGVVVSSSSRNSPVSLIVITALHWRGDVPGELPSCEVVVCDHPVSLENYELFTTFCCETALFRL